ncbi:MAG: glycoside hydrolase family 15 protein [Chloroflexota bacterium]|nr:glycoside hydrolase family 15 protein [Chloroflexota bacterium]
MTTDDRFPPISDYAFLSDCHSLALVARDGSIEWAVFHRFDGRPVFARILDRDIGGFFRVAPTAAEVDIERRYLPGTNVLETTFSTASGVVTLTDFMPVEPDEDEIGVAHRLGARHSLIRIVRGVSGSVEVGLAFRPRFEYGLTTPYIRELADDLVVAIGGADALLLESEIGPLPRDGRGGVDANGVVRAGDERVISITWSTPSGLETSRIPHAEAVAELDATVHFWETWSENTRYEGPYRAAVERSALAIKGLTDGKTGAVIAAASTSLPETIGGGRNWDYRYTWVRDSTTMLNSLIRLGHDYECRRFSEWIRYTTAGRADELQIMYGLGGERILTESELPHLSGYRGSRPVRIGNSAWDQSQLDTYGWLLASTWFSEAHTGQLGEHGDPHYVRFLDEVVDLSIERFDEVDEGIWEVRGGSRHFLFSKLLMWLAVDLGVRLVERHDGTAAVPNGWREARDEMRRRIETEGVDPARGVFTQAFGSTALDASALQISNVGFLPADDPRMLATIEAIDQELGVDGHIFRYRSDDGLAGDEGSFVFCTLWMVSALARSGQIGRAKERFEMVLSHASDLGLLAEEIDPRTGEQLGNFPQAFSHVGVISAALAIDAAEKHEDGWVPGALSAR